MRGLFCRVNLGFGPGVDPIVDCPMFYIHGALFVHY